MKKIFPFLLICLIAFNNCSKNDSSAVSSFANTTGAGGSLARYAILGNYLYVVDNANLKVYNISIGSNPVLKSTINIGFDIETIYPFKDKLFIGSASVVYIYSVANPEQPMQLGQAFSNTVVRRCDPVVAKDSVAYATLRTNGPCGGTQSILAVYNIQDINKPIEANRVSVNEPYGLGYYNNTLYVCDRWNGLTVFDITEQYNPKKIKSINDGFLYDVIPYNNQLICWASNGLIIYDITNEINPIKIASIQ